MTIIPSIIAKDQKELSSELRKLRVAKTLHLDVMDGDFVKNKSLWFAFELPKGNYEAHLMTTKPEMFIGRHYKAISKFILHIETMHDPEETIDFVKSIKKKVFLAINPETSVSKIKKYLKKIDGVLVMTVHPGKYGAKFLPKMLDKVKQLRKLTTLPIQVDGHITPETLTKAKQAGANLFVVGHYLQESKNIGKSIKELQKI